MDSSVFQPGKDYAEYLDSLDTIKDFRNKFFIPVTKEGNDVIYFAGNSLGLQPRNAGYYVLQELSDWKKFGVDGHFHAKTPWLSYHETVAEPMSKIVGAKTDEVVCMNSLTVNLHLLFVSFYRPTPKKYKILIESDSFPSDFFALESQIKFHGFDPVKAIIELKPSKGESTLKTEDIIDLIQKEGDTIALIWIAGVNYYSGQAFDIEKITKAGHSKVCVVGFDLAHAAGNLILKMHDWDVDFAVWCNYKYINAGPGAVGGCYVNRRFHNNSSFPKFTGWWGHDKSTRFLMKHKFIPIPTVESWQLSNPPILQLASLKASLDIFEEVGMKKLREKSELLTSYLEYLINLENNFDIKIITPSEKNYRGCQLSLKVKKYGRELHKKLLDNNVICDWRNPDVIRLAPVPLYNSFLDIYKGVEILFS